jgi:hypothetical protein
MWRLSGRADCQGLHLSPIYEKEAASIAENTKRYELEMLAQEIRYLEFIQTHFEKQGLVHQRDIYDIGIRKFLSGESVPVMTWYCGRFEENEVRNYMY